MARGSVRLALSVCATLTAGCLVENPLHDGDATGTGGTVSNGDGTVGLPTGPPMPTTTTATDESETGSEDGDDDDDDDDDGQVDVVDDTSGPTGDWWDTDWQYRRLVVWTPMTLDAAFGFPVALDVVGVDDSELFGTDAKDIRFVTETGELLPWQPERSDAADGTLTVWVQVPVVGGDSPTEVWMYHGNPDASLAGPSGTEVWAPDFLAVWHLDGLMDSTSAMRDLAGSIDVTDALLGEGMQLTPGEPTVAAPDDRALGSVADGDFTLTAWLNRAEPDSVSDVPILHKLGSGDGFLFRVLTTAEGLTLSLVRGAEPTDADTRSVAADSGGDWAFVSVVRQGDDIMFAVNGQPVEVAVPTPVPSPFFANQLDVTLGAPPELGAPVAGLLDEVRIAGTARTRAWIAAAHLAGLNELAELSASEAQPR